MIFWQKTEMTNRGDDPSSIYGWPKELVGKGVELTVKIDEELTEVLPDALSRQLGWFIQDILSTHYAMRTDMPGARKSVSIHTTIDPYPLPQHMPGHREEPCGHPVWAWQEGTTKRYCAECGQILLPDTEMTRGHIPFKDCQDEKCAQCNGGYAHELERRFAREEAQTPCED